ncbi:hypothetical protein ZWY2020_033123 [Hordeum vulgare]|nr:hypothetical protein ZWY2020_033123 [Hordeum vulgare]
MISLLVLELLSLQGKVWHSPLINLAKKAGVKRARKRVIHVVGRQTSMYEDPEDAAGEEEIPTDAPPPPPKKTKNLMANAIPNKSSPKPPIKAKKYVAPKSSTKDIPIATKEKGPASSAFAAEEEEDDAPILRKLRPHLPLHNAAHPVAEDMKKRMSGKVEWKQKISYAHAIPIHGDDHLREGRVNLHTLVDH